MRKEQVCQFGVLLFQGATVLAGRVQCRRLNYVLLVVLVPQPDSSMRKASLRVSQLVSGPRSEPRL